MSEFDGLEISAVPSVPTPDHTATADPTDISADPAPRVRKRILGKSTTTPGSKDSATKGERAKAAKTEKPLPPIPRGGFVAPVERMYGTIAMGLMAVDMDMATAVANSAHNAAVAWDELARTNPAIRRMLVAMMSTTATGALIAAHMPILIALMVKFKGGDPRVGMLAEMMGNQAEEYANSQGESPEENGQQAA